MFFSFFLKFSHFRQASKHLIWTALLISGLHGRVKVQQHPAASKVPAYVARWVWGKPVDDAGGGRIGDSEKSVSKQSLNHT